MSCDLHEWIKTICDVLGVVLAAALVTVTAILARYTYGLVKATQGLVSATQALFVETKEASKKQLQVNTWLHFIDRWDSADLQKKRKLIAAAVKEHGDMGATDPVLDFFEQVATVYDKECIDKDLVYSSLSHDAENWWFHLKAYVAKLRGEMRDEGVYDKFEKMVEDIHKNHPDHPAIGEEDGQKYLQGEIDL